MKRIKKLRLLNAINESNENRLFLQKLLVLPLLPPDDIELAFYWILSTTAPVLLLQFKKLLKYFYNQWIRRTRPDVYSVFLRVFRTNNFSEAYNKVLALQFGTHPNIWDFTEKIVLLQELKRIEYESLQNGNRIMKQFRSRETLKNKIIHSAWVLYQNNQFGHFLVDVRKIHNFIAENPIEIEFVVGEHITDCTMCEQSMTNHICQPCNHWFGCSRCVQNMRVFLARVQPNLRCPTCDNVIASFEKIF
ncbi:hypothetical protein KQX54_000068 [Cotesia glomerata]|uniref:RING-type domain-containing protein n=1 Tax=Cotesia glomerata TaxID=32391 RepID=A0AAV7I724_COTGL|nr:hypothetical protein KQX54_000068 [Cotesia glomerata]